ncbi:hypothetical protein PUN28_012390 [Cardiocondyla obscurior]|uniref:Uncharacterized protein n=1 Tax=Cardiocondyla obscurior TaxID=286306 RepID=A0AAW2FEK6_9HYME
MLVRTQLACRGRGADKEGKSAACHELNNVIIEHRCSLPLFFFFTCTWQRRGSVRYHLQCALFVCTGETLVPLTKKTNYNFFIYAHGKIVIFINLYSNLIPFDHSLFIIFTDFGSPTERFRRSLYRRPTTDTHNARRYLDIRLEK